MNDFIPHSQPGNYYLRKGTHGATQWFSDSPLESVLGLALLMTGAGDMSGAVEVTVLDGQKRPLFTFVANEGHRGCSIRAEGDTTARDMELLEAFMVAHGLTLSKSEEEVQGVHT